ncbi:MAG: TIGR01777 family oxidoreductase [Anaerolineae bacterium]
MRVVITGGTGLIGSALASRLVRDGHAVTVTSRTPHGRPGPAGVDQVPWDGRSAKALGGHVDGADAVVNLVGAGLADRRWTPRRKKKLWESRTVAGQAVARAIEAAARRPRVLLQASAVGLYGPKGDEMVTEDTLAGHDFLARLCSAWEASTSRVETMGVRRVVVRTGIVMAVSGGALARMLPPFRLGLGGRLGSGRQWMPWIHLADEVAALVHLVGAADAAGAYNLTAPRPVTNSDFTVALGRAIGRPTVMAVPAFALRVIFGEMAVVLLTGQRAVPRRLQDRGLHFGFPAVGAALADLLS